MKTVTRFIITRIKGNDIAHEYQIEQFDTINEAINSYGEESLLREFNRFIESQNRIQQKNQIAYEQRKANQ